MNRQVLAGALMEALQDEYRARARYAQVLERFGAVLPFTAIAAAEQRHIDALRLLFHRYGIPVPPDPWAGRVEYLPTLIAACEAGVVGEIENIALYESLLERELPSDVRQTFANLQRASREAHLPAFRRCLCHLVYEPSETREAFASKGFVLGMAFGATLAYLLTRRALSRPLVAQAG